MDDGRAPGEGCGGLLGSGATGGAAAVGFVATLPLSRRREERSRRSLRDFGSSGAALVGVGADVELDADFGLTIPLVDADDES